MSGMGKKSAKKKPPILGASTYHRFYYLSFRVSVVSETGRFFRHADTVWNPGLAEVTVHIAAGTVITRAVEQCISIVMFDQLTHQEEGGTI